MIAAAPSMAVLAAIGVVALPLAPANAADPQFEQFVASEKHQAFVMGMARREYADRLSACPTATLTPSDDALKVARPIVMDADGAPKAGRWTEFVIFEGCGRRQTLRVATFDALPGGWLKYVERVPVASSPPLQPKN